jgi:hypothetical protein
LHGDLEDLLRGLGGFEELASFMEFPRLGSQLLGFLDPLLKFRRRLLLLLRLLCHRHHR